MCAIYAFMRYCDDLSDDEVEDDEDVDRAFAIAAWKRDLDLALAGQAERASAVAGVRSTRSSATGSRISISST